ncbi:MAG: hypothetical protein ACT4QF_09360 [Sporichthyaceae bacterium]
MLTSPCSPTNCDSPPSWWDDQQKSPTDCASTAPRGFAGYGFDDDYAPVVLTSANGRYRATGKLASSPGQMEWDPSETDVGHCTYEAWLDLPKIALAKSKFGGYTTPLLTWTAAAGGKVLGSGIDNGYHSWVEVGIVARR